MSIAKRRSAFGRISNVSSVMASWKSCVLSFPFGSNIGRSNSTFDLIWRILDGFISVLLPWSVKSKPADKWSWDVCTNHVSFIMKISDHQQSALFISNPKCNWDAIINSTFSLFNQFTSPWIFLGGRPQIPSWTLGDGQWWMPSILLPSIYQNAPTRTFQHYPPMHRCLQGHTTWSPTLDLHSVSDYSMIS